jgi:hypothetical protein
MRDEDGAHGQEPLVLYHNNSVLKFGGKRSAYLAPDGSAREYNISSKHSPDSDGFVARIALLNALSKGKSPLTRAKRDRSRRLMVVQR